MLVIISMRNEIKIYFLVQFWKWKNCCRLMVKAFLLLIEKNGAIWTWHSCKMNIHWYHNQIKYYLPCQSSQVIIYGCMKKKLWMIKYLYYTIVV